MTNPHTHDVDAATVEAVEAALEPATVDVLAFDILGRAARLIAWRGWYAGADEGPNGRLSIFGALRAAAFGGTRIWPPANTVEYAAFGKAFDALQANLATDMHLSDWNDAVCRTGDEARAELLGAAMAFGAILWARGAR